LAGDGLAAARSDKIIYGVAHSLVAVLLIRWGGYRLFEKVMGACVAVMFLAVVATAVALGPPWGQVLSGLVMPRLPTGVAGGVSWTVALMGGVGGTVTILCYGYWIREEGRRGIGELATCRIDLASGYVLTALFGLSMVVIGQSLGQLEGGGARLMVEMARKLENTLGAAGPLAKWVFLAGAWGAIFTSLLGVWQSVPYLFADLWGMGRGAASSEPGVNTQGWAYQAYLYGIALVPIVGLVAVDFATMQKVNAVVGALFIPMLAAVLLLLNGRARWIGAAHKNSPATTAVLVGAVLFFLLAGGMEISEQLRADVPGAQK
jgi:Mn2+/Fe2+ NRAMP family transporter